MCIVVCIVVCFVVCIVVCIVVSIVVCIMCLLLGRLDAFGSLSHGDAMAAHAHVHTHAGRYVDAHALAARARRAAKNISLLCATCGLGVFILLSFELLFC